MGRVAFCMMFGADGLASPPSPCFCCCCCPSLPIAVPSCCSIFNCVGVGFGLATRFRVRSSPSSHSSLERLPVFRRAVPIDISMAQLVGIFLAVLDFEISALGGVPLPRFGGVAGGPSNSREICLARPVSCVVVVDSQWRFRLLVCVVGSR